MDRTLIQEILEVVEQAADDIAHLGVAGPYVFGLFANYGLTNSHGWVERVTLVEHSDAQIAAMGHAAAVWLEGLRENLHQRRFAVAVCTNNANSVTLVDSNGYAAENLFGRKSERYFFSAEQVSQVLFAF